jgi:hypothetical protein
MRTELMGALTVLLFGGSLALAQTLPAQAPVGPERTGTPAATAPALRSQYLVIPDAAASQPPPAEPLIISSPALPDVASPNAAVAWVSSGRFYVGAEYLLWWTKKSPIPVPLVTTTTDTTQMPTATIGANGTSVVLGNQDLDTSARHGARFTAGAWCDERGELGVEASYFFLASQTVTRSVASNGGPNDPLLAVPFFADDLGMESSFTLAAPSTLAGGATLKLTSRLQGAELNGMVKTCTGPGFQFDVLAGFRFLDLRENLSFATSSLGVMDPNAPVTNNGMILNTLDQFDTHNLFYGFQIAARAEYHRGDLFISALAKLALGEMNQIVTINGAAATNVFNAPPGGPFTGVPAQIIPGSGIFAQATNIGRTSRDQFEAVPEVSINVGYRIRGGLHAFLGYDLLYLSNVIRPGNQIDRTITFSQTIQNTIAGNASAPGDRPIVPMVGSSYWAQGLNFGVEWRY